MTTIAMWPMFLARLPYAREVFLTLAQQSRTGHNGPTERQARPRRVDGLRQVCCVSAMKRTAPCFLLL